MGTCNTVHSKSKSSKSLTQVQCWTSIRRPRSKSFQMNETKFKGSGVRENMNDKTNESSLQCPNQMRTFLCLRMNQRYVVNLASFATITELPCGCSRRTDILTPMMTLGSRGSQCSKHQMDFVVYCFECEMKLCKKCKLSFHEEYFPNHHLFDLDGVNNIN